MKIKLKENSSVEILGSNGNTIVTVNENGTIEGINGGTKWYYHHVSVQGKSLSFSYISTASTPCSVDRLLELASNSGEEKTAHWHHNTSVSDLIFSGNTEEFIYIDRPGNDIVMASAFSLSELEGYTFDDTVTPL